MATRVFGIALDDTRLKTQAGRFWRWWLDELYGLLPARLRQGLHLGHERLLLSLGQETLTVSLEGPQGRRPLDHFALHDAEQASRIRPLLQGLLAQGQQPVVKLPARWVLARTLELPAVVEENLRRVLGFEMDRHTPFKADQVYFDYRVVARLPAQRRLSVRLFVVPRHLLEAQLRRLDDWGVRPVAVEPELEQGVNLLPQEKRPRRRRSGLTLNRLLLGVALMLLAVGIVVPLWEMRSFAIALQMRVNEVQQAAAGVESLRRQRDALLRDARFIVRTKQQWPVVLVVVNELTRLLPDDTWLRSFQLNGDTVVIQGESPAASDLIETIEASPLFRGTSFRAPVTRNPGSNMEIFQIATRVGGEGGE